MSGLSIIFAGSGDFGLPTLGALIGAAHRIIAVISQPDKPAGRGKKLAPTPVAAFALDRGLPLLRPADINALAAPAADLLVVVAFGQKIAPHIVNRPRLGGVNLHASLLPRYRGAAPINWAILRGETVTGNSVIRLAERIDTGAVLGQSRIEIGPLETAGELHDRLAQDGGALMLGVVQALAEGRAVEVEQDHDQASAAPKLSRELARLDFARPAGEIARQIRGLHPWPGCRAKVLDAAGAERGRITLVRARSAEPVPVPAGTIGDSGLIAAGDGMSVEILELQPERKRPMPLAAYRNGHPWEPGMRLESL